MTVPTIKKKQITKHSSNGKEYPRITITGSELKKLGWDVGDEVEVKVVFDESAEYPVKIKNKEA